MSRNQAKAKETQKRHAQKKARKEKQLEQPSTPPAAPAVAAPAVATPPVAVPPDARPKIKIGKWVAVATLFLIGLGVWYQREALLRIAGFRDTKTKMVGMVPDITEMKKLMMPFPPGEDGKPAVIHFDTLHSLFMVNPKVLIRNTGSEIVEHLQIHVEEKGVADFPSTPYMVWSVTDKKLKLANFRLHKPTLDLIQIEDHVLAEKLKPNHEAVVPIWRPLIKAMQKAQVNNNAFRGKYFGGFEVTAYARGSGATVPDKSEESMTLIFTWTAENFPDELYKKQLDQKREVVVKIRK